MRAWVRAYVCACAQVRAQTLCSHTYTYTKTAHTHLMKYIVFTQYRFNKGHLLYPWQDVDTFVGHMSITSAQHLDECRIGRKIVLYFRWQINDRYKNRKHRMRRLMDYNIMSPPCMWKCLPSSFITTFVEKNRSRYRVYNEIYIQPPSGQSVECFCHRHNQFS